MFDIVIKLDIIHFIVEYSLVALPAWKFIDVLIFVDFQFIETSDLCQNF